jgi:hypothetical protein
MGYGGHLRGIGWGSERLKKGFGRKGFRVGASDRVASFRSAHAAPPVYIVGMNIVALHHEINIPHSSVELLGYE